MTKIVNEDSFAIGRSLDCAVSLTEDSISRVHILVHRRQDQIWIEDKGSSNGTFVNNVRITPNSLVNVVADDRIRVGKSDFVICISLEVEELENSIKAAVDGEATEVATEAATEVGQLKIQHQQVLQSVSQEKEKWIKRSEPIEQKQELKSELKKETKYATPAYNSNNPQFEGEKILHDAHKKAAQIIYDGELQAEKRAQAIYIEVRDRQAQADSYYQKKLQEAHKEADSVLINFEKQGQELLEQARQFAHEIRDEVDQFSRMLREKAHNEAKEINDEARREAIEIGDEARKEAKEIGEAARREAKEIGEAARNEADLLKREIYENALSKAEIDAEDLVVSAKAESKDILNSANQQAEAMLNKVRAEMETELQELIVQIDEKKKEINRIKKEHEELNIKALGDQEELENNIAGLKSEHQSFQQQLEKTLKNLNEVRTEESNLQNKILGQKKTNADLESQIGKLYGENKNLERKNKELQEQMGHFSLDIKAAEDQKKMMEKDLIQQKEILKERLEKESEQIIKESEERVQDSQLEMSKRMQKLEREMFEEIMGRKESLVKDIIVIIETRIVKVLEPAKWDLVSSKIFEGISETLEGKSVSFNEKSKAPKESASLQRKKTKESLRWMYAGMTAGVTASFLVIQIYNRVLSDKNPMRTIAAEASRKRLEDLDRRKFNPTQVNEIKETYVDAVIYTSGFATAYQNPEYQQNLYKAASTYLLKTWRVDEDKSIQVLSMSSALVKELSDKKQSIHPDYVKDGIAKMRVLEKESLERMKTLLGSEVRLDSYRRFERKFFETEILKK